MPSSTKNDVDIGCGEGGCGLNVAIKPVTVTVYDEHRFHRSQVGRVLGAGEGSVAIAWKNGQPVQMADGQVHFAVILKVACGKNPSVRDA